MIYIKLLLTLLTSSSLTYESCPFNRTKILSHCTFDFDKYKNLLALTDQSKQKRLNVWALHNQHSTDLKETNILSAGRLYSFDLPSKKLLSPIPLLLRCPGHNGQFHSSMCQFAFNTKSGQISQHITSTISKRNFTYLGLAPALFLDEDKATLSKCQMVDCDEAVRYEIENSLSIELQIERYVGASCQKASDCGPTNLYSCRDEKCQCLRSNKIRDNVQCRPTDYTFPFSDPVSKCQKHPESCLFWCNRSESFECVCPWSTTKKHKHENGMKIFYCEANENSKCHLPYGHFECAKGTSCKNGYCKRSINHFIKTTSAYKAKDNSPILVKIYLCVLSIVLFAIVCALSAAMIKIRSVYRNQKSSIFTADSQIDSKNVRFLHPALIGPYDSYERRCGSYGMIQDVYRAVSRSPPSSYRHNGFTLPSHLNSTYERYHIYKPKEFEHREKTINGFPLHFAINDEGYMTSCEDPNLNCIHSIGTPSSTELSSPNNRNVKL